MSRTRAAHPSRPAAPARRGVAIFAVACALIAASARTLAHPSMHETVAELSERIRAAPSDQALYLERGIAYSSDGKVELAFADFRKAEALGEPDRVAFDLGVLFYRTGAFAAARAALTRCLARYPAHALALDYRARAAREAGDSRAALADFEALFALVHDVNPGHYVSAADLLLALPGEGAPAALALLDRGMRQLGVIPQLQQRASTLERERGTLGAALDRHDTLAELLARSPDWRVTRAELLFAQGRAAEARSELDAASAALAELRATPARAELAAKIARLAQTPETTRAGKRDPQETP